MNIVTENLSFYNPHYSPMTGDIQSFQKDSARIRMCMAYRELFLDKQLTEIVTELEKRGIPSESHIFNIQIIQTILEV
ncbi:hypothetical protein IQ249_25035 [Lusitaniella coriacea LEGE 07157]|uniref:Uncharacterized protein n=1 Tax=Lusitaniella coriacea LEGE 07157 TaxID=945747 RepID=A0A8J7JF64_9CYAN|nr:hypothetical protein [Lusitaniella coriacea]MBE9119125.1 hypothetical protein [Lusitaniella coriacea LEGE 07157]